ncbi:hypothetical protein, partial [Aeromonas salmonicida]|uniref:hypothetical protein n=1 Tax=Aeromonas salmonicida TaxID=645 RepID=UPI0019D520BC
GVAGLPSGLWDPPGPADFGQIARILLKTCGISTNNLSGNALKFYKKATSVIIYAFGHDTTPTSKLFCHPQTQMKSCATNTKTNSI